MQQQHPGEKLQRHAQAIDLLEDRMVRAIQNKIKHNNQLVKNQVSIFQQYNPDTKIDRYKEQLHFLRSRLNNSIQHQLERIQKKHISLSQTLHAVSPLATLGRGYAIVSSPKSSTIISSTQNLSINDKIKIRLADGELISQVLEINHD